MKLDFQSYSRDELDSLITNRKSKRKTTFTRYFKNKVISLWFNQWVFFAYIKVKDQFLKCLNDWWFVQDTVWSQSSDADYPYVLEIWVAPERIKNKWIWEEKNEKWIENSYYVHGHQPLEYREDINPIIITKSSELCDYLRGKSFVFYTWAGISIDAVPWMNQLKQELQIKDNEEIDGLLKNLLTKSSVTKKSWELFFDKMDNSEPSQCHKAIYSIAKKMNKVVFTENLDLLHQRSWVKAYVPDTEIFNDTPQIDFIVTMWLSHDDRWMLAYCRKENPQIRFISINPQKVEYLSNNDIWCNGDCQILVPQLEQLLFSQKYI